MVSTPFYLKPDVPEFGLNIYGRKRTTLFLAFA
jgi:hypothetical protein